MVFIILDSSLQRQLFFKRPFFLQKLRNNQLTLHQKNKNLQQRENQDLFTKTIFQNQITKMNQNNNSIRKLASSKSPKIRTVSKQSPILKNNRDHKQSVNKSTMSAKDNKPRTSITKSSTSVVKQTSPQKTSISREYTKSTFQRYQQKLSIQQKISQIVNEIKERQSRLNSYFEIYRLLQSQIGQQRCLEHNNDLSLYCLNENRILCVHCVYGQNKHKTHKVLPLKDCLRDVGFDNNRLQQMIRRDLDATKMKIKTSQMNQKFIDRHFRQQLQQLERIYTQKLKDIEVEFCQKRSYVTEYFETIKNQANSLTSILKEFQQNIIIKLSILDKQPHLNKIDSRIVSRQTILSKISELSDLSGVSVEDFTQKDIAQNCLRSRVNRTSLKK